MSEITAALQSRVENGASDEQLMAAVYEELRAMAKKRMANEPEGHLVSTC